MAAPPITRHPDLAETDRLGFADDWLSPVYATYRVEPCAAIACARTPPNFEHVGGHVVGSGAIVGRVALMRRPEIVDMVAKLETADEAAIVRFYSTYGALDQPALLMRGIDVIPFADGDPVVWIRAHARTVRLCLELTEAIQQADTATLAHLVSVAPQLAWGMRERVIQLIPSVDDWDYGLEPGRPDFDWDDVTLSPRVQGQRLRATLLNLNKAVLTRRMGVSTKGTEESRFEFRAAIDAVYWHLMNAVEGRTVARCKRPGCGALFVQQHGSQEYCAPRLGQRESPCAQWVRQRRIGR
jgi:hypothetical protein